jgi:hypothetical protein
MEKEGAMKTKLWVGVLVLLLAGLASAADPVTPPAIRSVGGPYLLGTAVTEDTDLAPLVTNGGSAVILWVTWAAGAAGGDLELLMSETVGGDQVTADTIVAGTPAWLVIYGSHVLTPHLTGTLSVGSVTVRAYTF